MQILEYAPLSMYQNQIVRKIFRYKIYHFYSNACSIIGFALGHEKLIICFSGTARVTFNPPASKIFIAFQVFTLKNRLYIANCQFRSAVICRHFVC